ncbi:osmoprotectant transport system ATP-binding protein [Catalinimonas alkaloidigena]|uniref:Osmoprotectant transport system ATP-binding protein n=1 Tax=Catalinimonas alkaloidigena TaxID=1075417 RepID=A0A1G9JAA9_9BACT|nr:ATP-binding cassette domain-containing protein [Catalinimonas alkaloidigena]SDL34074.1 osmoprotectant transport system ATP-binding protein [Catalinimonas alkaloidigena]
MINVEKLSKVFGTHQAVREVSFSVAPHQTLVLLGTSGCGKTTTLKMLNRLIEPTAGRIFLNGEDIRELPVEQLRRRIGYVIQQTGLFPHYTVAENIAVVPRLLHWSATQIRQRVDELLTLLGLPVSMAEAYPAQLSGGQQQRVGIARALAADPPVLLLDEPFGALDPITRRQIRQEFRHLDVLQQKSVILVTHDLMEALELGDLICLMDQGEVQQLGTPRDLIYRPQNDFVRAFFQPHRFQAELHVATLHDLLPHLPPVAITEPTTLALPATTSVQEALERLEQAARPTPALRIATTATSSSHTTRLGLLDAFYRFQAQMAATNESAPSPR